MPVNDQPLVKTPYRKETFTEKQLAEVARCADPATGPAYFMEHFFYIQHPVKGKMRYRPYE